MLIEYNRGLFSRAYHHLQKKMDKGWANHTRISHHCEITLKLPWPGQSRVSSRGHQFQNQQWHHLGIRCDHPNHPGSRRCSTTLELAHQRKRWQALPLKLKDCPSGGFWKLRFGPKPKCLMNLARRASWLATGLNKRKSTHRSPKTRRADMELEVRQHHHPTHQHHGTPDRSTMCRFFMRIENLHSQGRNPWHDTVPASVQSKLIIFSPLIEQPLMQWNSPKWVPSFAAIVLDHRRRHWHLALADTCKACKVDDYLFLQNCDAHATTACEKQVDYMMLRNCLS